MEHPDSEVARRSKRRAFDAVLQPLRDVSKRIEQDRMLVAGLKMIALIFGVCAIMLVPVVQAHAAPVDKPTWTTQHVANANYADGYSGTGTFIHTLPGGRSMILYATGPRRNESFPLKFAVGPQSDGSFDIETVDPTDRKISAFGDLAVSDKGRAQVCYLSGIFASQTFVKYAVRKKDGWHNEVVDPTPGTELTAIALDSRGRPVVAYTKGATEMRIATKGAGGWTNAPVVSAHVEALDLVIDADDNPLIAYVARDEFLGTSALWFASYDGSTWSTEEIGPVSTQGIEFGVKLVLDPAGNPTMAYPVDTPVRGMQYTYLAASGWETELISSGDLWQPSLALDSAGQPHVSFYLATTGALRYAARTGPNHWAVQTVADNKSPSVRIGRLSSIDFDAKDRGHISYYVGREFGGVELRLATSTPVG